MEINKRDRIELKSYFVNNSIPTESNFADFIDAVLNQKEDGIVKLPGNPLGIEAAGDAVSQKKTINFYEQFTDPDPSWVFSLKPRSDPDKPATAREGFSISDAAGNSRLFIDRATGSVGIGTINPEEVLEVNGRIKSNALTIGTWPADAGYVFFGTNALDQKATQNYGLKQGASGADAGRTFLNSSVDIRFRINDADKMTLANDGSVGIGTATPAARLHVAGGPLRLDANQEILFAENGQFRSRDNNHRILFRRSENILELREFGDILFSSGATAGQSTARVIVKNSGNVGIGDLTPVERLDVNGRIKAGRLTIGNWPPNANYVFFGTNALNQASSTNYALLQEAAGAGMGRTFLNSTIDIRFRINNADKMTLAANGNVGIGTTNPTATLHVMGTVRGNQAGALRIQSNYGYVDVGPKNTGYCHFYTDRVKFYFNKPTYATGGFFTYSTREVKKDIRYLSDQEEDRVLDSLADVKLAMYRYKDHQLGDKIHMGLIAEEAPKAVVSDGGRSIDLYDYISYGITALKALRRRLDRLEARLNASEASGN